MQQVLNSTFFVNKKLNLELLWFCTMLLFFSIILFVWFCSIYGLFHYHAQPSNSHHQNFMLNQHYLQKRFWKKKNYNCNLHVRKTVKASHHYFMLLGERVLCIFNLYRFPSTQAQNERSGPLVLEPNTTKQLSSLCQLSQQLPARTKLTQLLQLAHGKNV